MASLKPNLEEKSQLARRAKEKKRKEKEKFNLAMKHVDIIYDLDK